MPELTEQHYAAGVVRNVMAMPEASTVTRCLSAKRIVRATRRRSKARDGNTTIIVTIGKPNYAERAAIARAVAKGSAFPINLVRVQKR